ncbi:MAG TPA: glycoside hydrolase family 99-like domain-containing protein, partial [Amaricoccus sp.]|nr:glycoside hydrolase family 99-like domain-containing protein [Amaricoccus sp.]
EWSAVTRGKPNFAGHVQPFLPADLGFYDLRVPETMAEQWRLAEGAGVDAFCVYHYWFDGRRLLETPLDGLLAHPEVPFRFYLCWANEAWRRNWDGLSGDVLMPQSYAEGFEAGLAASTLPYFADPRYVRPDGRRPRFVIYRPTELPDPAGSVARLRAAWAAAGHPEVELGAVLFHVEGESPVAPELFDFWVEMPPHGLVGEKDYLVGGPEAATPGIGPDAQFRGLVYDYEAVIRNSLGKRFRRGLAGRVIAGVMPSWDNTPRRRRHAHIAHGANPARFAMWLRGLCRERLASSYRREIFVNAWNEWAEKAVLEPSGQYGAANLAALRAVTRPDRQPARAREVEHV